MTKYLGWADDPITNAVRDASLEKGALCRLAEVLIPEEAAKRCPACGVLKAGGLEPHLEGCPNLEAAK